MLLALETARLHREIAPVAAKELLSGREAVHLELAVVGAALAAEFPHLDAAGVELFERKIKRRRIGKRSFARDERSAIGAHEAGDVRTDDV